MMCGLLFALHILGIAFLQRKMDALALVILQFAWTAVFAWAAALVWGGTPPSPFGAHTGGLLYLGLVSGMLATTMQNLAQRYAPPSHAALLLSLESVFGCLFSALLWGERFTPRMLVGFALILLAVLLSELGTPKRAALPGTPEVPAA